VPASSARSELPPKIKCQCDILPLNADLVFEPSRRDCRNPSQSRGSWYIALSSGGLCYRKSMPPDFPWRPFRPSWSKAAYSEILDGFLALAAGPAESHSRPAGSDTHWPASLLGAVLGKGVLPDASVVPVALVFLSWLPLLLGGGLPRRARRRSHPRPVPHLQRDTPSVGDMPLSLLRPGGLDFRGPPPDTSAAGRPPSEHAAYAPGLSGAWQA